jgi:hypothetical protein
MKALAVAMLASLPATEACRVGRWRVNIVNTLYRIVNGLYHINYYHGRRRIPSPSGKYPLAARWSRPVTSPIKG